MSKRCTNCTALEARYLDQGERILRLTAQIARENPDVQGVGELMATNNSENRMLGKRLMNAERRAETAEAELAQAQATAAELRDVLARNEWINVGRAKRCPECWRTPGDGHAWSPPCALALALTRAKQEAGKL